MRIRLFNPLTAISLAASAALVIGAPAALRAQAPAPIVIPVIVSLTGAASFIGKSDQQSLQLIEGLVNKAGGINHRRFTSNITMTGRTRKPSFKSPIRSLHRKLRS